MARIAFLAAGAALILSQPVLAAPAQPSDNGYNGEAHGPMSETEPFYHNPGKVVITLGALGAFTWGLVNAFKDGHHGRRPTSP